MNWAQNSMDGIEIKNGKITSTRLGKEHGSLIATIYIEGDKWSCGYGNFHLDYFSNKNDLINSTKAILNLLEILEIDCWENLKDTYVRVVINRSIGGRIEAIGHIYKDLWITDKECFWRIK